MNHRVSSIIRGASSCRMWRRLAGLAGAVLLSLGGLAAGQGEKATPLGALARSMAPGTWAELETLELSQTLGDEGVGRNILGYATRGVWMPGLRVVYFIGSDHGRRARMVQYDEASNTWSSVVPQPPWIAPRETSHGYDHNTSSAGTGAFYHRPFGDGQRRVHRYLNGVWTTLPPFDPGRSDYVQDSIGVAYWPGIGLIIYNQGQGAVYRYDEGGAGWTRLSRDLSPPAGPSGLAEYSPGENVIVFGGGGRQPRRLWRLSPDLSVTALRPPPVDVAGSNTAGILTTDPVSGEFLYLSRERTFWRFNALTDVWTPLPTPPDAVWTTTYGGIPTFSVIATPISTYGVVLWVTCDGQACRTWLYKHVPAGTGRAGTGGLGTEADADFQRRCATPGVTRCEGFDAPLPAGFLSGGHTVPGMDETVKASGTASLRFTIPPNSPANMAGTFSMNFTPGSLNLSTTDPYPVQFGEGDEFYVQWRMRFSPEFLTTTYRTPDGSVTGPKLIIVGTGDRPGVPAYSCTDLEIVVNAPAAHGRVPMLPRMYHSCGAKDGAYEGLYERRQPLYPEDYLLQNARRNPPCVWTAQAAPPCVGLKANQWMTFQLRVKVGTWYRNTRTYRHDSEIQLWIAEEGQPSKLVIDLRPVDAACQARYPNLSIPPCHTGYDLYNPGDGSKYGKLWFTPYMTGKDPAQAHPTAYVWIDEVIISRRRVADPSPMSHTGFSAPPAPIPMYAALSPKSRGLPGERRPRRHSPVF